MKKVFFIFCILLVGITSTFADEYTVATYPILETNYWTEDNVTIRYEDETGQFMFYDGNSYSTLWMIFTAEDLNTMRKTAEKALEWKKIALENKAEVSKEIPDSMIYVELAESSGSSFYMGARKVPVSFNFVSTTNAELIAILVVGGSTTASTNKYIDLEFTGQAILDIQAFADAISEESINEAIKKHNDAISNANDLFN